MSEIATVVANSLDIWTSATQRKSGAGRGSGGKRINLYGIERLRALILDLAVRGKLVPQDAEDAPAAEHLLTASQRFDPASAKGRRKQILPRPDENPKLPPGWAPTHLGSIVDIVRGITFPGSEKSKAPELGRVACLRTSNVQDQIEWDDILYIRDKFVSRADQYVRQNDIIISMANSRELVGKVAIIERDPETPTAFGGFLAAIRAHSVDPRFLMTFLRCPATKAQLIDDASQTTNIANISLSKLNPLPVPLPPLAEQRRIVAKVGELMALCDALERESTDAMTAHQALVEALLATLVNSADVTELTANWVRLEIHFDTLFTTDASIEALKQTILDLAVRGKLVEQVAADEPASALMVDVQRLMQLRGLSDRSATEAMGKTEMRFDIPLSWEWVRLGSYVKLWNGFAFKSSDFRTEGIPVIRIGDLKNGEVSIVDAVYVSRVIAEQTKHQFWIPEDALLIAMSGATTGKTAFNRTGQRLLLNQRVGMLEIFAGEPQYLRYFFETTVSHNLAISAGSAIPNLSAEQINNTLIPLPPLAEQQRIVRKADALMKLCDALKIRLAEAAETRCHLADAIVEKAAA